MSESAVYRPHPEAPAQATLHPEARSDTWRGLNAQRFEIVSRGDFVPGILYLPDPPGQAPAPLLLLEPGTAEGMDSAALACAAPWVKEGLAVATIDLPLHGERSSPKLSERLVSGIGQLSKGSKLDPETGALVEEFARQATSDLIRTLDALAALPAIDGDRIGFMGFGVGAVAGSYLLANDPRSRAAVLALTGGGQGPSNLDPATHLANTSGTSVLIVAANVAANDDGEGSAETLDALFRATAEPKAFLHVQGHARVLPDEAIAEIWRFLRKELGL
jgi:dienelactone hydrolase